MARTPDNFKHEFALSTAAQAVVPDPGTGKSNLIKALSFFNSGTTVRTVTLYIVANGSTPQAGVNEFDEKVILPRKSWVCTKAENVVIESGMTLQAKQDSGTDVLANADGSLIT